MAKKSKKIMRHKVLLMVKNGTPTHRSAFRYEIWKFGISKVDVQA